MSKMHQDQKCYMAPACDKKAFYNFQNTIQTPISLESIDHLLGPEDREVLSKVKKLYVWGNLTRSKKPWMELNPGDVVGFYINDGIKRIAALGTVFYKKHDPDLSKAIWRDSKFEYTFFLKDVIYFNLGLERYNDLLGYKKNAIIQGFRAIGPQRKNKLLSISPSFYDFFREFQYEPLVFEEEEAVPKKNKIKKPVIKLPSDFHAVELVGKLGVLKTSTKNTKTSKKSSSAPIDYIQKQETSTRNGLRGEAIVMDFEKERLKKAGKLELVKKIRDVSKDNSHGYDIISYEPEGAEIKIEVKVARLNQDGVFEFYLSAHEKKVAETTKNYYFYLVFDIDGKKGPPQIYRLVPPFEEKEGRLIIEPIQYLVKGRII